MKNILLLLILLFNLNSFSQKLLTGVGTSCYIDDFPTDLFASVNGGARWKHFSSAVEFSYRLGYRETGFQLLGVRERVYFRSTERGLNFFLEFQGATQISGKRKGSPMESGSFLPVQEYSSWYRGDRFLRANFQGSANLGVSVLFKDFELQGSYGLSKRVWSSNKVFDSSIINKSGTTGHIWTVGLNYYF